MDGLYKEYDFNEPWDGPKNRLLAGKMPKIFAFPDREQTGSTRTNYFAVIGPETVWPGANKCKADDIPDGEGTSIMIVENLGLDVNWMEPRDLLLADFDFTFNSPRGLSSPYNEPAFVTCDDMVYRLSRRVTPETLRALFTRNGKEPVSSDGSGGWHEIADGRTRPK